MKSNLFLWQNCFLNYLMFLALDYILLPLNIPISLGHINKDKQNRFGRGWSGAKAELGEEKPDSDKNYTRKNKRTNGLTWWKS